MYTGGYEEYFECVGRTEAHKCVFDFLDYNYAWLFDQEGMDKLVMLVSGLIYEIDQNDVDREFAFNTWLAIQDFSTGEYDDLFRPQDLELVKRDVNKLIDFFSLHPELKG